MSGEQDEQPGVTHGLCMSMDGHGGRATIEKGIANEGNDMAYGIIG